MMETTFYTLCAYLPIHLLGVAWVIAADRPELVPAVGIVMVPISLALYFLNIRLTPGKLLFTYVLLQLPEHRPWRVRLSGRPAGLPH